MVSNWFKYHVLSRGRPYAHVRPRRSTREHLRWIWRCFSPREPHFCPPVTMGFSTSELYLSLSLSLFIPLLSFSLYHPASLRSYAFSRSLSRASIWYPVIIPRLSTRESLSLSPSLSLSLSHCGLKGCLLLGCARFTFFFFFLLRWPRRSLIPSHLDVGWNVCAEDRGNWFLQSEGNFIEIWRNRMWQWEVGSGTSWVSLRQ